MEKKTIDQILSIEPKLQNVIDYANMPNRKNQYWEDSYHESKMMFQDLVGFGAQKEEIRNHVDYETFLSYIVDIIDVNSKQSEDEGKEDF